MYSLLLAVIYLAFISLGLPDSLLGSAWPIIHIEIGADLSYMGIISMVISACTIISSFMSERLTKKFGAKFVVLTSIGITAVALFGFSGSHSMLALCLWGIPYGLGAGSIDSALNNYVSLHYSSRHMAWLHCFWGAGALISPYVMSYALTHSVWNNGYRYVGFIQLGIALVVLFTLPLWKVNSKSAMSDENGKIIGVRGAFKIKGVLYIVLGFFAYCAAESTTMNWASTYFVGVRNIPEETAAAYASLFYIGITVGRFLCGFITEKLGDRNMIRLGTAVLLCGLVCVMLPVKANIVSIIGFVVIGFGCAPIYPCIIHSTPYNFGKDNSQAIIGIQMAFAYTGSTFMSPLFGVIGQHIGMSVLPYFCLMFFVMTLVMAEMTFKITAQNKKEV